jgi:diaminohydroxyphosphoribosylaminopyrimidine deaminase/5-amino-6-(5-phosphoribosylamino)uracil reductase
MSRALALARRGEALASPNPMVGAVLVRNGRVVGEGFHTYEGLHHAEVIALEAAGRRARGATLYINLEPCCHQGRTGPCTRALIAAGVARVVAAMPDPNPAVAGQGLKQLRAAGVEVVTGVLEPKARQVNEAFAVWIRLRRPLVTLKSAMTLDGQMVLPQRNGRSPWITSEASRAEVQRMRHGFDAILTGIGTVLADNPLLTDRTGLPRRRPLLRVVLDSRLRLPPRSRLARTAKGDVLVFTSASESSARARALRRAGIDVVRVAGRAGRLDLRAVLDELGRRDLLSVLFEPGPILFQVALDAGLVDKIRLFYAPTLAGASYGLQQSPGRALAHWRELRDLRMETFGPDFAVEGYLRDVYRR